VLAGHGRRRRYPPNWAPWRISEEIDALEVMGRQVDGLTWCRPGRWPGLGGDYPALLVGVDHVVPVSAKSSRTVVYGQGFRHLRALLPDVLAPPTTCFWSFVEVIIMAGVVMLTHCYYGYNASGGPVGVGEAVGRSMRLSRWSR